MNQESHSNIYSDRAPQPVGPYPHARRVGSLLFLSGVGPRSRTGGIPDDFEAQCHSVFRNVEAVLQSSNANMSDVVDVTVFLTDMESDFETMNRIYAQYFNEPRPCRTTVEVTRLPTAISIELKCIASLGHDQQSGGND